MVLMGFASTKPLNLRWLASCVAMLPPIDRVVFLKRTYPLAHISPKSELL